MTYWLLWILFGLVALFTSLLVVGRKIQTSLPILMLLLISFGGLFVLFNNIFILGIYLIAVVTVFFLIHAFFVDQGGESQVLYQPPIRFLHLFIFGTFVLYLVFVLFTAVFAGREHMLEISSGFGVSWLDGSWLVGGLAFPILLAVVAFLMTVLGSVSFARKEG